VDKCTKNNKKGNISKLGDSLPVNLALFEKIHETKTLCKGLNDLTLCLSPR
jgi:hypothetical protein